MFFVPIAFEFTPPPPAAEEGDWSHEQTPYEVLGVSAEEDAPAIRAAYLRKSKLLHPDRPGGDEEGFKRVSDAYRLLTDDERRARYDADPLERDATRILSEMNVFHEILREELFGPPPPRTEDVELLATPSACVMGDPHARVSCRAGHILTPVPAGATHGHVVTVAVSDRVIVRATVHVKPENVAVSVVCDGRARGGIGVMHLKGRDVYVDFAVGLAEVMLGFRAAACTPEGTQVSEEWAAWSDVDQRPRARIGVPALGEDERGSFVLRPKIRPSVDRFPLGEFASAFQKIIRRVYTVSHGS